MFQSQTATPGSATLGEELAEGEDAVWRDLPAGAATGTQGSLLANWRRSLLLDASVAIKSLEILVSGARVCNAAAFAMALTGIEDAFTLHRARQSCRTTCALLAVDRDHAVRLAGEAWRRTGLMARIARDVGQEATYPVRARFELLLENLRRAFFS